MRRIDEQIAFAEQEAAKIGFVPPASPEWHPYFWAGWLAALKLLKALEAEDADRE